MLQNIFLLQNERNNLEAKRKHFSPRTKYSEPKQKFMPYVLKSTKYKRKDIAMLSEQL